MKRIVILPGILLLAFASGCSCLYEIRDELSDCKINICNHLDAKASYREMAPECVGLPCPHSFRTGYISGYISVSNGGNGNVPSAPQISCWNHMWLDCCADCEKMEAWYDGFELGAMAAKAEGMSSVNQMVTRSSMQTQSQPLHNEYAMPPSNSAAPPTTATEVDGEPEMPIPPTPKSEPEAAQPQTRRIPSSIFN